MKKIIVQLLMILFTGQLLAQTGTWTIQLNQKKLITSSQEDEVRNQKKLSRSCWKKADNLVLHFAEDNPDTWYRSFLFYDEDDQEIMRVDSLSYCVIDWQKLKSAFNGKKYIKIYTTVSPKDSSIAVRMRRIHLFTLLLPS